MQRKLNIKLLLILFGTVLITSIAVHLLHGYQLSRNAYRLLERGDQAREEKDLEKAQGFYTQYLSFVPDDADTSQKLAEVLDLRATGNADRIRLVVLMEQVLRVKPREDTFRFRLVQNLIALGRWPEAIDHLRKLERTWSDKAEVLHMIGWCQDARKDYDEAVISFEKAIDANKHQLKSYVLLAEILQERLTRPDDALKIMDDLVKNNPETYRAYLARGRYHRRHGDAKEAERDLERAHQLGRDEPEVLLEVADAARVSGHWQKAVELLQEGLKSHPKNIRFYLDLAAIKTQMNQDPEAIRHLKDGLAQSPKSPELSVILIELLIDQKQYAEARTRIDDLIHSGLRSGLPSYLKARLGAADGKWSDAINLLESARLDLGTKSEWASRVNALLGMCYRHLGDSDQEMQAFRRAVAAEPEWMITNVGLGESLLNNGRIEDANQVLEGLRKRKDLPANYWLLLSRARIARQLRLPEASRRFDDAEAAIVVAETLGPSDGRIRVVRADLLAARKDLAGAAALLEKARTELPGDITIWCAVADLAARQHRWADAERILEEAAAKREFASRSEWWLALCRVSVQRSAPEDRVKLPRLAERMPKSVTPDERAGLLRTLAESFYRLGDFQRAESTMREVARALPRDLRSRLWLFDFALQHRQPESARSLMKDFRAIEGESGSIWRYAEAALIVHEAHGRRDQLEAARKKLDALDKAQKSSVRVANLLATISELQGNYQQAAEEYARALELGEVQPRTLASLLQLLVQRREFGRAETEIIRYEQQMPLTRDLAKLGAEVALGMREKRYAKIAVQRAEQAVTLPPRDYRDALWLASIYQAADEAMKAETMLKNCLDQASHVPEVWVAWLEFLVRANRRADALRDLEWMKKQISPPRLPLTLARCYEALRQPAEADQAYQSAIKMAPDDFVLLSFAADFYYRADRLDLAKRHYERLLDPTLAAPAEATVQARRRLAIVHGLLGQSTQAIAILDANKAAHGELLADQRIRLFVQGLTASKRIDAIQRFNDTLRRQPASAEERLMLAYLWEAANNLADARTLLADLAEEESNAPRFFARLARVLIQMEEFEECERAIVRLEVLEPGSSRAREIRTAFTSAKKKAADKTP